MSEQRIITTPEAQPDAGPHLALVPNVVPQATEMSYADRLNDPLAMYDSLKQNSLAEVVIPATTEESAPQHLRPSTVESLSQDVRDINKLVRGLAKGTIPPELARDWKTETASQYSERLATETTALKEARKEIKQELKVKQEAAIFKQNVTEHTAAVTGRQAFIDKELTKARFNLGVRGVELNRSQLEADANTKADALFPSTTSQHVEIDGSVAAQRREAKDADTKTYAGQLKDAQKQQLQGATKAAELKEAEAVSKTPEHQARVDVILVKRVAHRAKSLESEPTEPTPVTPSAEPSRRVARRAYGGPRLETNESGTPDTTTVVAHEETSQSSSDEASEIEVIKRKNPVEMHKLLKEKILAQNSFKQKGRTGSLKQQVIAEATTNSEIKIAIRELVIYFDLDENEKELMTQVHGSVDEFEKDVVSSKVDELYVPQVATAMNAIRNSTTPDERSQAKKVCQELLDKYAIVGNFGSDGIDAAEAMQNIKALADEQAAAAAGFAPKPKDPTPPVAPTPTSAPARRRPLADRRPAVAKTASLVRQAIDKIPSRREYKENTAFVFDSLTKSTRELLNNPDKLPAMLRNYKEDRKFVLDSLTKSTRAYFNDPEKGKDRKKWAPVGALAVGAVLSIGAAMNGSGHDAPKPSSNIKTSPLKPASPAPSEAPITVQRIVSSVLAPEAAPKTAPESTEKLTERGDNIWKHAQAKLERQGSTVNNPAILAEANRIQRINNLSDFDTTHMDVGEEFRTDS